MKTVNVAAALILAGNKVLATQRGYGEFQGGWEFPGGKIEPGETPEQAAIREVKEELDIDIEVRECIYTIEYDYPDFHLSMACYICNFLKGTLVLKEHKAAKWLGAEELDSVDWLPADIELMPVLREYMLACAKHGKEIF